MNLMPDEKTLAKTVALFCGKSTENFSLLNAPPC
jgi:hypothetical protein